MKNFDIFLIFAQNIDCGYTLEPPRRGGSNEYPQSMFWSKNKYPCEPQFCYIKVGFEGVHISRTTYHIPYMQTHTQGKVDKGDTDDDLELVNENVDESGLEYIGVKE